MSEVVLEREDITLLIEQLRDEAFPDSDEIEVEEAEQLMKHVGKVGYLQLGFAHQGVMFICEMATDWYDSFQQLMETIGDLGGILVDDHEDKSDRDNRD